ncbi:MAG TPA: hypothetical protein VGF44_17510 [Terriglobales bacterium]
MTHESEREKWLEDIDQRQRNIVFPDTKNNESRLWRSLLNNSHTTILQWIAVLLIFLTVLAGLVGLILVVPGGFSWQNIFDEILVVLAGALFLGAFLMAMSWSISLDPRLKDKSKKEEMRKK